MTFLWVYIIVNFTILGPSLLGPLGGRTSFPAYGPPLMGTWIRTGTVYIQDHILIMYRLGLRCGYRLSNTGLYGLRSSGMYGLRSSGLYGASTPC